MGQDNNERLLMETTLDEFETAIAEVDLGNEDEEGQWKVTMSKMSRDIVLAALRYFYYARELYEEEE